MMIRKNEGLRAWVISRLITLAVSLLLCNLKPLHANEDRTEASADAEFIKDFEDASVILARRPLAPFVRREAGFHYGFDVALSQAPRFSLERAAQEDPLYVIPQPIFAANYAAKEWQDDYGFIIVDAKPTAKTTLKYYAARWGRSLPYDNGNLAVGWQLATTYLEGRRRLGDHQDDGEETLGLISYGGELNIAPLSAVRPEYPLPSLSYLPAFGIGVLDISSDYRHSAKGQYKPYDKTLIYGYGALTACLSSRATCTAFELHYDHELLAHANVTIMVRM